MSNNYMESLPNELIEKILCCDDMNYKSLCRLALTSTRMHHMICNNNEIWRNQLIHRWPNLYKHESYQKPSWSIKWREDVKMRHLYGVAMRQHVMELSSLHYDDDEMSHDAFKQFIDYQSLHQHASGPCFQIDELESILNDGKPFDNLTNKYYAQKVIRFLRHKMLAEEWHRYLNDDGKSRDLFGGALLISSWCQPNSSIDEDLLRHQIELMAELTLDEVRAKYPRNVIIVENDGKCLCNEEAVSLQESKWPPDHCKQILLCLNEVLFNQLRFRGNQNNYYDAENSYIDKVIEKRTGIPITLCIVYQTIAAKLGVKTWPVNFPGHFLLKWDQHQDLNENERYTYIDVFEEGHFISYDNCRALLPGTASASDMNEYLGQCKPIFVFRRMCRNLVEVGRQQDVSSEGLLCLRNALELLLILSPEDIEPRLLLSRVYIHLNINLEEVNNMLQQVSERDPSSTGIVMFLHQSVQSQLSAKRNRSKHRNQIKLRDDSVVKFAVGLIMRHKKYNYTCVIYGWDPVCAASRDWIFQMGVHNLPNKEKQPFYNVLVEDGSSRYAAQENLEFEKLPRQISHPEIGKYFCKFAETHYIPNEQKNAEYPEDEAARKLILDSLIFP